MRNAIWKYQQLDKLLGADFPLARRWAFEKLVDLYGRTRVRRITDLIDDSDDYISSGAIRFLSAHHHRKWAFRILRKFQDSKGDVASSCAIALGEVNYSGAIHVFRERIEHDGADFETLTGIIAALKLMPGKEATDVLMLLGEMYSNASNGVFLAKICDALLSTRDKEAVSFVAGIYLERAFSLDDKGNAILRTLIHHTGCAEFLEEFHSFLKGQSFDILRHIKESVRYRLGEILGEDFVRKTAEKYLRTNYLQLLGDICQTGETALYSRRLLPGGTMAHEGTLDTQELFNYYFIDEVAAEPRRLHVMNLGEVKTVLILCICALLRIVYPPAAGGARNSGSSRSIQFLLDDLETSDHSKGVIGRIADAAGSGRKLSRIRKEVHRRLESCETPEHTARYLDLLAELEPEKDLDLFWDFLKIRIDDAVCQAAEKGMISAGSEAVDFISKRFEQADESQKMFAFGVLSRVPVKKSVDLVLKYFDEMWDGFRDFVLYAVSELGSRRFAGPLVEKLEECPATDIEETYLLLAELNGISDERLNGAKQRILEALEKAENLDEIQCDRSRALRRNHCNRKLICRRCHLSGLEAW